MENLNEFMLLFRMPAGNTPPNAEQIEKMHQQWQKFIGEVASRGLLVNVSRLGFEGVVIKSDQTTENKFLMEDGKFISGNLTMKAKTMEAAVEMAKQCPVLFAGGTVEVRTTIPMN